MPQTRARAQASIDFDYIWFRLVESARYLLLMLDNAFLEKKEMGMRSPIEQLEQRSLIIGGRILNRNKQDVQELTVAQKIDHRIQFASSFMTPHWWLVLESTKEHPFECGGNSSLFLSYPPTRPGRKVT